MLYDNLTIELSEPITYRLGGATGEQSSKILMCSAPTSREGKITAYLKQNFMRALLVWQRQNADLGNAVTGKLEEAQQDSQSEELGLPPALVNVILLNSDLDFYEYQLKFQQLICSPTGVSDLVKIDGELALTSTHFKNLAPDDVDQFMGEYLTFFLVNSLLKKMSNG